MKTELQVPSSDVDIEKMIDFKIFSGPISIKDAVNFGEPEQMENAPRVVGIGSSECEDLAGDRMLKSALEDMCRYSVNSSIWLNHRYDLPDDLFGSLVEVPQLKQVEKQDFGPKRANKPFWAVEITAEVETENPQAMKTLKYIEKGRKIGFSIGCQVKDFELRKDNDGRPSGLDIKSVETLEWSTVGIPANSQSWIRDAIKGLRRKGLVPPTQDVEEWGRILTNFADFDTMDAIILRRIGEKLGEKGLGIAELGVS